MIQIWKQFQDQMNNKDNANYDAEMRRRAQEKQYNDYINKRTKKWSEYSYEHDKK
jgi:hypothetical protein